MVQLPLWDQAMVSLYFIADLNFLWARGNRVAQSNPLMKYDKENMAWGSTLDESCPMYNMYLYIFCSSFVLSGMQYFSSRLQFTFYLCIPFIIYYYAIHLIHWLGIVYP